MSRVYPKSRLTITTDTTQTDYYLPSPTSLSSSSSHSTRSTNPTTLSERSTNSSYSLKPLHLVDQVLGPQPIIQLKPSPQKGRLRLSKKHSAQRLFGKMSVKRPIRQNTAPAPSVNSRSTSRASSNNNNNTLPRKKNNMDYSSDDNNNPALNYPSPPSSLFRSQSPRTGPSSYRPNSRSKKSTRPPFVVSFAVKSEPVKYHAEIEIVNRQTLNSPAPKPMRFVSPPLDVVGQKYVPVSKPKPAPIEPAPKPVPVQTPKKVIKPRSSEPRGAIGSSANRLSARKRTVSASKTRRPIIASRPKVVAEPVKPPTPEPVILVAEPEQIRTPTPPPTAVPPRLRPRSIIIPPTDQSGESELQRVFSRRASMQSPAMTPSTSSFLPLDTPVDSMRTPISRNPIELPPSVSTNTFLKQDLTGGSTTSSYLKPNFTGGSYLTPNLTGGSATSSNNGNINTGGTGISAVRRALLKLNFPAIEDGAIVSRDARIQAEIEKLRAQKKVGSGRTSGQLADIVAQTMAGSSENC